MSTPVVLVPGAPVLVPELAGAAREETRDLVAAAVAMVRTAATGVDSVVVTGIDAADRRLGDGRGSLRRWGVDLPVGAAAGAELADADVPDPALLGWWFLDRAGVHVLRSFVPVSADDEGSGVTADPRSLVVVVADGSASLTPRAPIPEDPRGLALDSDLSRWLRSGGALPDPGAEVASEIGWWSRAAWSWLAERVGGRPAAESASSAPFGVGYHCAHWPASSSSGEHR